MTLGLVPEILDPVDMILLVGKEFRVVDPEVMKFADIKGIIRPEMIRVDNAIGGYFLPDDGHECFGFGIGNDCRVDLAAPFK